MRSSGGYNLDEEARFRQVVGHMGRSIENTRGKNEHE